MYITDMLIMTENFVLGFVGISRLCLMLTILTVWMKVNFYHK